jgi:peptidoglycan hydrolase-like protein with peptidoglycan-binding domain
MVRNSLILAAIATLLAGTISAKADSSTKPAVKSTVHHKTSKRRKARKGAWKRHGQQKIDAARATEIQQALIREKYLDGAPTGAWDSRTEAAMARYQADNGWQSKITPDSRALIKLGLGPDHQNDLQNMDARSGPDALASSGSSSAASSSNTAAKPR